MKTDRTQNQNRFFKIRGDYFVLSSILSVKHNRKSSIGTDDVPRAWVIKITVEAAGDARFTNIWASDEEIASLLTVLEQEKI